MTYISFSIYCQIFILSMRYILNISSDFETVEQWAIPKQKQEKKPKLYWNCNCAFKRYACQMILSTMATNKQKKKYLYVVPIANSNITNCRLGCKYAVPFVTRHFVFYKYTANDLFIYSNLMKYFIEISLIYDLHFIH